MAPEPITVTPPSAMWAQNNSMIFLTFNIESLDPVIKLNKDSVYFKGKCGPEKQEHEVTIPLYADIKPEDSKYINKGRKIEVLLLKEKDDEPFWPTLTNDKKKHHWLKVDFNRWIDEDDESDERFDSNNFCDMFDDKLGALDDREETESEDEDDNLPDLEPSK